MKAIGRETLSFEQSLAMSEGHSWLRQPVEPCAESCCLRLCRAVRAWWRETTDVVILNSPWLKRSTGRALRCIWISIHLLIWLITFRISDAMSFVKEHSWLQLELALSLVCFAHVLCVSVWTARDDVWTGLLLCVGQFLSFRAYNSGLSPHSERDDLADCFVILCHCNVHPVAIALVFFAFAYTMLGDVLSSNPRSISWTLLQHDAHICIALSCLLLAFTTDFSKRIKAVTTGMLHGAADSSGDPVLQSPVAGRSGRTWCWLAGMHSWLWAAYHIQIRTSRGQTLNGVRYALLALPPVALIACCWRKLDSLQGDMLLAFICQMPPTLPMIYQGATDSEVIFFFHGGQQVLATQTLIQAGCHPLLCAGSTLLPLLNLLWGGIHATSLRPSIPQLMRQPVVCLVLICSHFVDYSARMKAIQEGFLSSEGNARTLQLASGLEPLGRRHSREVPCGLPP